MNVLKVKLPVAEEAGAHEGSDGGAEQGHVGVDVAPVSSVAFGQQAVETRPKDPEDDGPYATTKLALCII